MSLRRPAFKQARARTLAASVAVFLLLLPSAFSLPDKSGGAITIAQPKVWQFERVNAMLDGLLRDIEGISLDNLQKLDPNAANASLFRFLQTALEVGVKFDQGDLLKNRSEMENLESRRPGELNRLKQHSDYLNALFERRTLLAQKVTQVSRNRLVATDPTQVAQLAAEEAKLLEEIKTVEGQIDAAKTTPTVTGSQAAGTTFKTTPDDFTSLKPDTTQLSSFLDSMPKDLRESILKSPSYPATQKMDNLITLLYERMARQISALQDDLIRHPNQRAYLMEFNVGLYPSANARKYIAQVKFDCMPRNELVQDGLELIRNGMQSNFT